MIQFLIITYLEISKIMILNKPFTIDIIYYYKLFLQDIQHFEQYFYTKRTY